MDSPTKHKNSLFGHICFHTDPTKSLKLLKSLIRGRGRIHKIFVTTNLAITWSCESQNANMDQRFLDNKGILQTNMSFRLETFELSPCVTGQLPVTIENTEKRKGKKVRNDWGSSVRSKKFQNQWILVIAFVTRCLLMCPPWNSFAPLQAAAALSNVLNSNSSMGLKSL